MKAAQKIADYVKRTAYIDLPKNVVEQAKLCLLDWLGVTLAGSVEELTPILTGCLEEIGGAKQATVLGKGIQTSVLFAALINGTMSHALDYDDVHAASFSHPSVPLAPAVLAAGEYKQASGKDVLTAFVLGFEVETRIGAAAGRAHYDHGWHATSTIGRFGAAVGAGKLLGLDENMLVNALGIAGTQTGGVRQVFGTMCKPFHAGKAAMDGVLAALLAQRGFTSSDEIIEGKYGFLDVFSPEPQKEKILAGLGKDYQIMGVGFKPYASCAGTHTTIDALKQIQSRERLAAGDVLEINLELAKLPLDAAGIAEPKKALEGKFSVYHCAALAFLEGSVDEDKFTDEKVNDPRLVELRKKVKARLNPDFKLLDAKVTVVTKDGREVVSFVSIPKGQPENPLTFSEMEDKFTGLAKLVLPEENIRQVIEKVKTLENIADLRELFRLCCPKEVKKC
jgi:2-methylcitrate dehydratase PrpD